MNKRRGVLPGLAGILVVLGLISIHGCGGDHASTPVTFRGDVAEVKKVVSRTLKASGRFLAARDFSRGLLGEAFAQSSCGADVAAVLACAVTQHDGGDPRVSCAAVDENECTFSVAVRLSEDGDSTSLVFVQDQNGNGRFDPEEPAAVADGLFEGSSATQFCNGDIVVLENVEIDFSTLSYTADSMEKSFDSCNGASPSPTETSGLTPTATVTGTPPTPTPTPTVTPTPTSPPTPTPTCAAASSPCSASSDCCAPGLCLDRQCVSL